MMKADLSEVERLKMENLNLRMMFMQQQMQQLQAERLALITKIEDANPGCEWREGYGLVEKEEETEREPYPEFTPH
jgi:hypothetical protein